MREPITLPCGNTMCRKCIPELHARTNISYPATANRLQGFKCPFTTCKKEHAAEDCSVDVVLNKIMDVVRKEIYAYKSSPEASREVLQVEEKDKWSIAGISSLREEPVRVRVLPGGRLTAAYTMAEMGELAHDSEVIFTAMSPTSASSQVLDSVVLAGLKEAARSELDCQVCYGLFLDPFTTPCGHTLCRACLHRVQDHSSTCPICRRQLAFPPGVNASQAPSNALLTKLLISLCPDALAARAEAAKMEETALGELDTPIFVCTLSFPSTPTFLHVFEPRYRLMMRRAVESGDRKFGMVLHSSAPQYSEELGTVSFYQYGTMLQIVNMHVMPDGRSIIESMGVSRFRILRHGFLDGYMVGKVERIDDVSLGEEEAIEAAETSSPTNARNFSADDHFGTPVHRLPTEVRPRTPVLQDLDSFSTQELMEIASAFVKKMRETSAPWLHRNVVQAYGECPDDPALFPWWFASVIPTSDMEKYRMLETTTVRQRLKMCVVFAVELERQRWYDLLSSPLLLPTS
jgi:Lon protease-like protein